MDDLPPWATDGIAILLFENVRTCLHDYAFYDII